MIGGRWAGIEEAVAALAATANEASRDDLVARAMLDVARPIAEEMGEELYQRITRETGETGAAVEAARVDSGTPGVVVVEIGPRAGADGGWKVKFWERGTSTLPARPFMRPTWDRHEAGFSSAVTAGIAHGRRRAS